MEQGELGLFASQAGHGRFGLFFGRCRGGVVAAMSSLGGGDFDTLTQLIYEAREKSLERIQGDAQKCGADEVVGVKTHVYDLVSGLIEFLAIGTAVKKIAGITTQHASLLLQVVIPERETYFEGGGEDGALAVTFSGARGELDASSKVKLGLLKQVLGVLTVFLRLDELAAFAPVKH